MIISEEAVSLTKMANNFAEEDVSVAMLEKVLVTTGYISDKRTITDKGLTCGISYKTDPEKGGRWPVYDRSIQERLSKSISWMLKEYPELRRSNQEKNKTAQPMQGGSRDEYPRWPNLQLKEFVIIDTETTGIDEDDEVVELAVVSMDGEVLYHSYYYPEKEICPAASAVNHLTKEGLEGNPKLDDTEWEKIKKAIDGKPIMGHNIGFDKGKIIVTMAKTGANVIDANVVFDEDNLIDTIKIAKTYIPHSTGKGFYKLDNLTTLIGITRPEQHDAADDCRMTLEFVNRLEDVLEIKRNYNFIKY